MKTATGAEAVAAPATMAHGAREIVPEDSYQTVLARSLQAWADAEREVCRRGEHRLSAETIAAIRASRVLAAPIPKSLGGAGADLFATAEFVRRVAQVAPCTALALAMPLGNAANARVGDELVAAPLRAALARGRAFLAERALAGKILAVANSEPGSSGDLQQTRTRAERRSDGVFLLTGKKSFATLGPDADYFLCAARLEDGTLDAFFVARSEEGLELHDDWSALGMQATASVSLTLQRAAAAAPFLYPGAIAAVNARHWSTLLLAAVFVGIGEGALAAARECAPESSSYARATVADATLSLDAARGFLEAVARDETVPCPSAYVERCRRVKTFAARTALEATTRCMMIAGGRAYRLEHALGRALVDAAAGPLLRPPLAQAMDGIAAQVFGS